MRNTEKTRGFETTIIGAQSAFVSKAEHIKVRAKIHAKIAPA